MLFLITTSCETNEIGTTDCITCQTTQTAYCFTEGYAYYVITAFDGTETAGELVGSWEDTKLIILAECNGSDPITDCYTCTDTNTEYCFTTGNNFYTISVAGANPTQELLNGDSWANLKTAFIDDCQSDGQINGELSGSWAITDFQLTSTNVISFNDNTVPNITSITNQNFISGDVILTFNNDDTYTTSGSMELHSITTTDSVVNNEFNYTSTPENGTWGINGNQITITSSGTTSVGTITELTDTTLKIKYTIHNSVDNPAGNSITDTESIQTFTKQ